MGQVSQQEWDEAKPDLTSEWEAAKPIRKEMTQSARYPDIPSTVARLGGLTARNVIEGIGSVPATVANLPAYLYNKGADVVQGDQGYRFPEQNQALSNLLTQAGLPKDETWQEKASGFGVNMLSGLGAFNALVKGVPFLAKEIPVVPKPEVRGDIKKISDVFLPGGAQRLANAYTKETVGEKNLPQLVQAARTAREIVPGSKPTMAEAVSNLPEASPILAHQRMVARTPGGISGEFGTRTLEQQAARNALLAPIAKTPEALTQAEAARASEAALNYSRAGQDIVTADARFLGLLQRPSMSKVISRAKDIAAEQSKPFKFGTNIPEQVIPSKTVTGLLQDESGSPLVAHTIPEIKIPAKMAKYPVESLHYIKMAMDDLIKNPERFGIGKTEATMIGRTQKEFVSWLAEKSPAYDYARQQFANASKDIDKMQIGQFLQSKLVNPSGTETPGTFLRVIDDAQKLIKNATGNPRFNSLEEAIGTLPAKQVQRVASDLERKLASVNPAQKTNLVGGGNVAQDITAQGPSILWRPVVIANWLLKLATKGKSNIEGEIDNIMAQRYLNPETFADAMQQIPKAHKSLILHSLGEQTKRAAIVAPAQIPQEQAQP